MRCWPPAARSRAHQPGALRQSRPATHHDAPQNAEEYLKGVKSLVLSHFVPAEDPALTDEMWIEAARTHFRGTIVAGKDLMEIR